MNTDHLELKVEIAAKYAELSQRISRLEKLLSVDAAGRCGKVGGHPELQHEPDLRLHEGHSP